MTILGKDLSSRSIRLYSFIYGSVVVLFLSLGAGAYVFSETYLKKEQARASDSAELITRFFDSHHQGITEELSMGQYESIHLRIREISKKLGNADYDLVVADSNGNCVLSQSSTVSQPNSKKCALPEALVAQLSEFQSPAAKPALQFDYKSNRYVYMAPTYVGEDLTGYFYVSLSDPYEFYQTSTLGLVLKFFAFPIFCILGAFLFWLVISFRLILKPYLDRLVDMERKQAVAELAGQVAHNIRSPLVVVNSVTRSIRGLDETQRRLLISASSRIEKIANHLISQFTSQQSGLDSGSSCFLLPIVESIVAEKVAVLGSKSKIEISSFVPENLSFSVVPVPTEEMAAILSNLLNNAIEAFGGAHQGGVIDLVVESVSEKSIQVLIQDNGPGIAADVLAKVNKEGGTYGKPKGSGLGLQHAKEVMAKVGGKVTLNSEVGRGTTAKLEIPLGTLPAWCPSKLDLSQARKVIVLDDDPSVHLLWQDRLNAIDVTYVSNSTDINFAEDSQDTFYILDYEINDGGSTGLDLITQNQLGNRSVLVTSYFNEPEIQQAIQNAGSWMIPKFMINRVEVIMNSMSMVSSKKPFDLVLIDDDPMIHELWEFGASQCGKRIKAVKTLDELNLDEIDPGLPIFIDKNLPGISGMIVAKTLHVKGFKNISITTGDSPKSFAPPKFIRQVTNKSFPTIYLGSN